jgi:hypothetical protein
MKYIIIILLFISNSAFADGAIKAPISESTAIQNSIPVNGPQKNSKQEGGIVSMKYYWEVDTERMELNKVIRPYDNSKSIIIEVYKLMKIE